MSGPVRVLVLQWAHSGRAHELAEVEDVLSQLAVTHGATLVRERGATFRASSAELPPDEVHILEFPDEASVDAYVDDPLRAPWAVRLGDVLARTLVIRLDPWDA